MIPVWVSFLSAFIGGVLGSVLILRFKVVERFDIWCIKRKNQKRERLFQAKLARLSKENPKP